MIAPSILNIINVNLVSITGHQTVDYLSSFGALYKTCTLKPWIIGHQTLTFSVILYNKLRTTLSTLQRQTKDYGPSTMDYSKNQLRHLSVHHYHILSGTAMPNNAIAFRIVSATASENAILNFSFA